MSAVAPEPNRVTLLGGDYEPSEQAGERADRLSRQAASERVARHILSCMAEGYAAGEITFENFCRQCRDALAVDDMPGFKRQQLLGVFVEFALTKNPPKKKGRSPRQLWFAEACHRLVDDIKQHEGLPIVRGDKAVMTAYERAVEILRLRGINNVTAVSVEKARAQWAQWAQRTEKP